MLKDQNVFIMYLHILILNAANETVWKSLEPAAKKIQTPFIPTHVSKTTFEWIHNKKVLKFKIRF